MRTDCIFFVCMCLTSATCLGQAYFDAKGLFARVAEDNASRASMKSALSTSAAYHTTDLTSGIEKLSKSSLLFSPTASAYINYSDYQGMCNYYINPWKRKKCNNALNYLREAHSQALYLVQTPSLSPINQGVKEQIMEKYASITNRILFELEQLKIEVDNDTYYRQLLLH